MKKTSDSFGDLDIDSITSPDGNIRVRTDITSLAGCPEIVYGDFNIGNNALISLIGGPKEVEGIYSANNCELTSLDGLPGKIGGYLDLSDNGLSSLKGINNVRGMKGWLFVDGCQITSHILGVFFIKGCMGISADENSDLWKAAEIVNQHIDKGRAGLLPCQRALIEAGLADFAQI
jgi:hypothetical protein